MPSGFREESKQDVKEVVKPSGSSYAWEEFAKYNKRRNAHVAVRIWRKSKSMMIIIHQVY